MYKLSIVIPVFNAEDFLRNTIEGIIKQSFGFKNIELILVDDKSSDGSRLIIEEYADKYDNIKPVFMDKNSGMASCPRNIGINGVTSDYLMFLDSDDGIFEDYCEILYNKITSEDVDIVHCNHSSKLNNNVYIPNFIENVNTESKEVTGQDKLFLRHTAWGNIYRTSLIKENNINFPATMYEDGYFSIKCLLKQISQL